LLFRAAVKQRKIAISLAVVGAIAAPFVLHTYKMDPKWRTWTPLTAADIQQTKLNIARLCSTAEYPSACQTERKFLDEGGYYAPRPSVVLYLLLNMAVAVAGFWHHLRPDVFAPGGDPPLLGVAQHVMAVAHFSRAAGSGVRRELLVEPRPNYRNCGNRLNERESGDGDGPPQHPASVTVTAGTQLFYCVPKSTHRLDRRALALQAILRDLGQLLVC
jgi:hypothetical protein